MKKFLLLLFVLAVFAGKKSQAQVVHSWTSPDTLLIHQLIQHSPGNYELISSLRSGLPPNVYPTYLSVSYNAQPFDVNEDDVYFTNEVSCGTVNGFVYDLDWTKYSLIVFEWYVEYSDNTYEDYWIEYHF